MRLKHSGVFQVRWYSELAISGFAKSLQSSDRFFQSMAVKLQLLPVLLRQVPGPEQSNSPAEASGSRFTAPDPRHALHLERQITALNSMLDQLTRQLQTPALSLV
jgi:hypothetical protein